MLPGCWCPSTKDDVCPPHTWDRPASARVPGAALLGMAEATPEAGLAQKQLLQTELSAAAGRAVELKLLYLTPAQYAYKSRKIHLTNTTQRYPP